MGNNAPNGYLPCDGTIYNINDYKNLADQIKKEFGSYNYFGGDGSTTFAVPDLRGEFLRGTGTNSKKTDSNTYSSGANVGEHQEASIIPNIGGKEAAILWIPTEDNYKGWIRYVDRVIFDDAYSGKGKYINRTGTWDAPVAGIGNTSRPTNTSILYCIKY